MHWSWIQRPKYYYLGFSSELLSWIRRGGGLWHNLGHIRTINLLPLQISHLNEKKQIIYTIFIFSKISADEKISNHIKSLIEIWN
jgi:hypothetical protein